MLVIIGLKASKKKKKKGERQELHILRLLWQSSHFLILIFFHVGSFLLCWWFYFSQSYMSLYNIKPTLWWKSHLLIYINNVIVLIIFIYFSLIITLLFTVNYLYIVLVLTPESLTKMSTSTLIIKYIKMEIFLTKFMFQMSMV